MMNAMGIHIYGGGFTIGAMNHFHVDEQWEEIKFGSRTFDSNFSDSGIKRLLNRDEWNTKRVRGIPFVFANPPCAPWSSANMQPGYTKDKRFHDKRLGYTKTVMETAMEIRPDIFICESVENAYNFGFLHYNDYIHNWMKRGYSVTVFLTDGIIHGLPSMRRRFHFIAHRYEFKMTPPNLRNFKPTTVRDAIWDLRERLDENIGLHTSNIISSVGKLALPLSKLKKVPVGGRVRDTDIKLGYKTKNGAYSSMFVKRLAWDAPAFTIIGLSHLVHPDGERLLTWRESLRLLSFPDWFTTWSSKEGSDTVTPLMGTYLSGIAKKSIKANVKVRDPKFEVIDWRPYGTQYHIGSIKKSNPNLV